MVPLPALFESVSEGVAHEVGAEQGDLGTARDQEILKSTSLTVPSGTAGVIPTLFSSPPPKEERV